MQVTRIHEDPRVTKPYTEAQWQAMLDLGHQVDAELVKHDVRLTMGGEPTFVSIDDMDGAGVELHRAVGKKRELAGEAAHAPAGHGSRRARCCISARASGIPGEPLPRWALGCYWRTDGKPLWRDAALAGHRHRRRRHAQAGATMRCTSSAA
jgi:uncharacterized protein (DUF2126 family)